MDETWILYLQQSNIRVENLPSNVNFNLGSDYKIVFNITTINATTYDILLNNEYISSYQYLDNDTISLDLNFIYSNFTYSNYTIFNNTKFEYTNLMLTFYNAQNNTYTHTLQIKVFDNLPIVIGSTSLNIDYEIGTSLPLEFQVNDDNPDMVYVYTGNTLLYANEWSNNINLNVNNFINSSNKLGGNYYKVIFEDMDHNQVEYNLNINVLDTINPVFTSVFADNYVEGDDFGVISFSVVDVTLDRYAVFANDIELANSTFGDSSYIEISNSGLLTGNYDVEIIVYDRSNNVAKISTSFFVESQGVNSTETSEISIENNNTMTITETVQGNNSQNISIPESAPIADLPFMVLVSFIGLYIFRKNRK